MELRTVFSFMGEDIKAEMKRCKFCIEYPISCIILEENSNKITAEIYCNNCGTKTSKIVLLRNKDEYDGITLKTVKELCYDVIEDWNIITKTLNTGYKKENLK